MKKIKEHRRLCTGQTEKEFMAELKQSKKWKEIPKKCYLCKRPEGTTSVHVPSDAPECYTVSEVHLNRLERRMTKDVMFEFYTCLECAALVGIKVKSPFGKRTVGK